MATFDRLQIGLNGSTEPSNFTIEIYEWNVTGVTADLRTTVATGVTRTTTSTFNGGTLNGSNYGISGITGNDYYLKLTANNTCHTSATYSLREPALALSVHTLVPVASNYGVGNVMATVFTGFPTAYTNSLAWHDLASFDDVFYLADNAPVYPSVGAGTTFSSNFTFTHLGTYDSTDTLITSGKWVNGLLNLSSMTLEQQQSTPYKTYNVYATQTPNIAADGSGSTYHSQYRITFNPSNTSRTFTVYWAGSNV
jgi:hypothetical protein